MEPQYTYRAKVKAAYDGDTVTVDIDLGFGIWMNDQTLRLYGIDTPELRGDEREQGIKVRDEVHRRILGRNVIIRTFKDSKGKYGRWLAEIFVRDDFGEYYSLNAWLVENGMARPYYP